MFEFGWLLINAYDQSIGTPLQGAVIKVINNDNIILTESITDASGKTVLFQLPCPPKHYSLIFGSPKPYAQYNVEIYKPGFKTLRITGVEILAETTALQNVILIPNNKRGNVRQEIVIKEHTLYTDYPAKILEDSIKPLLMTNGYIVLQKPVVPETIVVHDGVPEDTSASNYHVTFNDYIKNVACCEIYATWPESTIRANVLAIISFTLNRVYTEWYRNKGYNFTITSSTTCDHAFSYGRNIFKEISTIVDELFNTYISKPNLSQPLLTQYCDGKKVQCPSQMSQWGSKELGESGYNHIDIIKNYYGQDINFRQAEKVSGVPKSFPGSNLQIGSTGDGVRTIQMQLNSISNNYPAIPKLAVNGVYDENTVKSVKTFQNVFDLSDTGIVDLATWYKISYVYVAVMKLAK